MEPIAIHVRGDGADIERAISEFAGKPNGGLILPPDATLTHRKLIVALAAKHALPAVYPFREFVKAGGLLCYGTNIVDVWRRGVSPLRTA